MIYPEEKAAGATSAQAAGQVEEALLARAAENRIHLLADISTASNDDMLHVILAQVHTLLQAEGSALTIYDQMGHVPLVSLKCGICPQKARQVGEALHRALPIERQVGQAPRTRQGCAAPTAACIGLQVPGYANQTVGYLCAYSSRGLGEAAPRLLLAMSDLISRVLHERHQAHLTHQATLDDTLEGWARALAFREARSSDAARQVAEMTVRLARAVGVAEDDLVHLRRGALLHDIGKLALADSVLRKPGPLSRDEWELMREHPRCGYDLLAPLPFLGPALDIPLYHHERWDGSGYPYGLRATDIPLAARIFAIVDVWHALCTDRPYRSAWSAAAARDYIRSHMGQLFDPEIVPLFLQLPV